MSWSLVLVSWWLLCGLYQLFSISIYLVNRFDESTSTALPEFFPCAATFPEFASFPLSAFLCFASVSMNSSRTLHELKLPLLSEGGGGGGEEEEIKADTYCRDNFSSAGFWSRLTFRWLNPVFEEGMTQRLELHHVPPVPCSETAETAHALLQETLSRKKPLPKAIINAVWRPLIISAAFAGINTLSSYVGPLLLTNFVKFLSGKGSEESGNSSGYVLAFIFFFGKTLESMSQRHWYLGARQIGVRVRATLMVSIYNKSLMTKYSSTSSGKVINFLEVDVERIGEFFFYIHGIWMLPLQVSLALVILYQNLGLAASASALLATVMVMASNIPLAKSQEKLHSKIMEAKDSRIKATSEALKCMRI